MRIFLPYVAMLLLVACSHEAPPTSAPVPEAPPAPAEVAPAEAADYVELHSLTGSGLKFNGVYHSAEGPIQYFMRFFERGNVVLVAGQQKPDDPVDLKSLLTEDAKSGRNSVHNTPVTQRNDSLFFTTMATRGAIIYAGVVEGDSVRFLKHSRATGKQAIVSYRFLPD